MEKETTYIKKYSLTNLDDDDIFLLSEALEYYSDRLNDQKMNCMGLGVYKLDSENADYFQGQINKCMDIIKKLKE